MTDDVRVRGGATAEELAVVLVVIRPRRPDVEDAYARWRRTRLEALRSTLAARCMPSR